MKLTQAIGKRSWWPPGTKSMPDCDRTSQPDKHGGWELGTWYTRRDAFFPRGVVWPDRPAQVLKGAWILHTYTEPERLAMLASVLAAPVSEARGKEVFLFDGSSYYTRFRQRLIDLLSDPDDPPVFYMAD